MTCNYLGERGFRIKHAPTFS